MSNNENRTNCCVTWSFRHLVHDTERSYLSEYQDIWDDERENILLWIPWPFRWNRTNIYECIDLQMMQNTLWHFTWKHICCSWCRAQNLVRIRWYFMRRRVHILLTLAISVHDVKIYYRNFSMLSSCWLTFVWRQNVLCPLQAAVISVPGPTSSPEALWLPFIHNIYPDRLQNTYFLPPLYFNRTFYTVGHFAGEEVVVMQQQQQQQQLKGQHHRRYGRSPAPSTVPQVAGRVFTPNPSGLQPSRHQDSDVQDDQAQQSTLQCLRALSDSLQQAMVVVSQLSFRKYLDNLTDPLELAAAASLPSSQHLSKRLRDGECDVLVIHRQQGIVVGEIKSVGGSAHFNSQPESQQNRMIVSKVEAALGQLNNQETVLRQLVSDLDVHVTKILILPNVTSAQLLRALANTPLAQVSVHVSGADKCTSVAQASVQCQCHF